MLSRDEFKAMLKSTVTLNLNRMLETREGTEGFAVVPAEVERVAATGQRRICRMKAWTLSCLGGDLS